MLTLALALVLACPQRVYVELEAAPWVWRLEAVAGSVPRLRTRDSSRGTRDAVLTELGAFCCLAASCEPLLGWAGHR